MGRKPHLVQSNGAWDMPNRLVISYTLMLRYRITSPHSMRLV